MEKELKLRNNKRAQSCLNGHEEMQGEMIGKMKNEQSDKMEIKTKKKKR
jgi:hypothetical protein